MKKYCAKIENGTVTNVIVCDNEKWANDNLGGTWVATTERVGKGWTYNETEGFRLPQPYPSWVWNGTKWEAPKPYPNDGGDYVWDEEKESWEATL